jgi:hypothetical protein
MQAGSGKPPCGQRAQRCQMAQAGTAGDAWHARLAFRELLRWLLWRICLKASPGFPEEMLKRAARALADTRGSPFAGAVAEHEGGTGTRR